MPNMFQCEAKLLNKAYRYNGNNNYFQDMKKILNLNAIDLITENIFTT